MLDWKSLLAGGVIIGSGFGLGALTYNHYREATPSIEVSPPIATLHDVAWYEAHRDVLRADNVKCSSGGVLQASAFCQNLITVDSTVSNDDVLAELKAASKSGK